jgi:hypothetical protein
MTRWHEIETLGCATVAYRLGSQYVEFVPGRRWLAGQARIVVGG